MKASVRWIDEVAFEASSESGHRVVLDGPPDQGGANRGARPMELVLMGLGGCTAFDVVTILRKARQDVTACRAELSAERAQSTPAVFTRIHVHFVVQGRDLREPQVKRAIELSASKYCSASLMLERGGVEITHDYEILPPS
jgi:putative redox protein